MFHFIFVFQFVDENEASLLLPISREFYEILSAIMQSPYYTSDPQKCCLYIPSVDLLNQNKLRLKETSQALASLKWYAHSCCMYNRAVCTLSLNQIIPVIISPWKQEILADVSVAGSTAVLVRNHTVDSS